MMNFGIFFITFILFFNFIFFYLDDFKLSTNKYLRLSEILSPLFVAIFVILIYYDVISIFNSGLFIDDNNRNPTNISVGANVEIG